MDLDRMLADPAFDLPVPPDGLSRVKVRARRIMVRRRVALTLPALALVATGPLLLSGGGGGTPDVARGPSPASSLTLPQDVVRPVDGRAPDGIRTRFVKLGAPIPQIEQALDKLRADCMTTQGLPYEQMQGTRERDEATAPVAAQYAVTEEQASDRGYGIAERRNLTGTPDPNAAYLASLNDTDRKAWYQALDDPGHQVTERFDEPFLRGINVILGGCSRTAVEQLYGDVRSYGLMHFVYNGSGLILSHAAEDGQLQALNARWSACMRLAGVGDFMDPRQAQSAAGELYQDDAKAAPAQERQIALADARCQAELDYVPQREAVEDRYLAGMTEQYADVMKRVEGILKAANERAGLVLREP